MGFDESDLRVVFLTAAYHVPDGVTMTIRRIAKYVLEHGGQTMIITADPCDPTVDLPEEFGRVVKVLSKPVPFQTGSKYSFGIRFDEKAKEEVMAFKPTIMHLTVPDIVGRTALRWAEDNNIPVIATWHSNYSDYLAYYNRDWFKPVMEAYLRSFYKQVITFVPTPYISNRLIEKGFDSRTLAIWGRGVDRDLFTPEKRGRGLRERLGIKPEEVAILWAGRTVYEKRPDVWGGVVQRLVAEGLPVKGIIAGGVGPGVKYMAGGAMSHLGWLGPDDLAEAYAASDILLFPSAVETFGNVTLEAMSSGVPGIVESGCSGHLIESGVNGYLCDNGTEEEYYEVTKKLVVDTGLRKRMGAAARQSSEAWGMEIVMRKMTNNYRDVAKLHSEGKTPKAGTAGTVWSNVCSWMLSSWAVADYVYERVPLIGWVSSIGAKVFTFLLSNTLDRTMR
eukprot:gene4313-6672_t